MNLSNLDLNLFLVLHALLEERSASKAAARLHVTQPAVSNALARLRHQLGDPLFVRTRRMLAPTPRALAMAPLVADAVARLEAAVKTNVSFDQRASTRRFRVACSDYIQLSVLPSLRPRFEAVFARANLQVVGLEHALATDALASGDVDLIVGLAPERLRPGYTAAPLFEDELVCIAARNHPEVKHRLGLRTFARWPHIHAAMKLAPDDTSEQLRARVDGVLARQGLRREIRLSVPNHTLVPFLVASSDSLAVVPRSLAETFASFAAVKLFPLPFQMPALRVSTVWHARAALDAGVLMLRQLMEESVGAARERASAERSRPGSR